MIFIARIRGTDQIHILEDRNRPWTHIPSEVGQKLRSRGFQPDEVQFIDEVESLSDEEKKAILKPL
ncbi:MAG: hypothetical protein V1845_02450 [bacterium]